ncbi:A/G-specific adenine glycosylase [soil metagenome]
MDLTPEHIKAFQEKILSWYAVNQRDLPWRQTRDPYKILVSEVMSQQTQLSRVIPKYEAWLVRFPTIKDLASAPVSDVLKYWSGLGYNRRALNLQKTAQVVIKEYGGKFPKSVEGLIRLPGLGKYTASAVACFAFNLQIPVIDTNIRKVVAHEFFSGELPSEKTIEKIALEILPDNRAYVWNQALMDYSALVLKEKKIPIPKQSHFLSSNRYFRGQTIKLLLETKTISLSGLMDYFAERNAIDQTRLEGILTSMKKDGLITYNNQQLSLPDL